MKKITLMLFALLVGGLAIAQTPNDFCADAIAIMPSPEGTGCAAATFTLPFVADGTTDSGVPTVCSTPGRDQWFTWTATSTELVFNSLSPGNPGIAIFANCTDANAGTEIDCLNTFSFGNLSGWAIGDNLIIQIYDFSGSTSDVAFCLEQFTPPNPITLCDPMTDTGAPVVNCPDDIETSGSGADCNGPVAVEYMLDISDDCEARISQNTDETVSDALDCSGGQLTGHLRIFDLAAAGIVNSFALSQVEVGIFAATNSPVMTVNIYDAADIPNAITSYLPPIADQVAPIATADFTVADANNTIVTVPISAVVDPNTTLVVEVISPTTIDFLVGYNSAGAGNSGNATEQGYIGCQGAALNYTTTEDINFSYLQPVIVPSGSDLTITQTAGLASGDMFPAGDTMNSFDITDAAGNTTTCSFNVNVGDADGPIVEGPVDIFTGTGNAGGNCSAVVSYDMPTATDNCADDDAITLVQTEGLGSGGEFPVGTTTETYEATDTAGNVTVFSFDVTISDTSDPVIDCPDDFAVAPDDGADVYTIPDWSSLASDNCSSGADLVFIQDPAAGDTVADGSMTDVTFTATDAAGNTVECTFVLTVDETLSTGDFALQNAISVYPNPVADQFTIRNGSNAQLATVTISDINGRILDTIDLSDMTTEKQINIANYASGVYFARISTGNASAIKRIVKR